jgi:hypothetical protein
LVCGCGQEGTLRRATAAGDPHGEIVGGLPDGIAVWCLDEVNRVPPARIAPGEELLAAKSGGLCRLQALEIGRVERSGIAPQPGGGDEADDRGERE